ncbi:MAG: hypothetical protein K8963_06760, partial [Proteobacteria bacterium]|nr:hypothetical protein [Pseudomonadota bacterium]
MQGSTLPQGVSVNFGSNFESCAIAGTPTTPQSATEYTIIATNNGGSSLATVTITIEAAPGSLIPPSNFATAATQGSPAIAPRAWTGFADADGQAQDQEGQDQGPASLEASPPADADADADGLIDIATTEQLHNMRYNLAGTSLKTSQSDPGNNTGCPSTGCFGYELINDIDFDLDGDGRTWTGNVEDGYTLDADDTTGLFPTNVTDSNAPAGFAPITGIATFDFEGNGFAIRNMIIRHNHGDVGFVSTRGQSTYRNLSFTNLLVDALATNTEPSPVGGDTSEVGVSSGQVGANPHGVGASPRRVGGVWASSHAATDVVNTHGVFVT